jgi:hypothetical protein
MPRQAGDTPDQRIPMSFHTLSIVTCLAAMLLGFGTVLLKLA